ncbi:hypothetical protein GCM10011613_31050 [Cellvibrio zantedeschiae]|uniref:Ice-binding protein C-terminal domain-containing protein n=1 Tax=Cellvibrio zantedeschiae TaxID=1237077 RepID=A0ABQ3B8L5_9GAMM|nr:PEP-CTERM sorting domain-containing protein [Cellvibrio zantedeschiae]GGY83934.1 hypothetical protein GCM10011613_31050 [Cellvibrio zantedeschiae]
MNKYFMFKAFLMSALLGITLNSYATLVTCTGANTLSLVEHASACQRSTEFQDYLSDPMTVNTEGFFGSSDWVYFDKKDDPAGDGQSGTWSLTNNEWSTYANIMLVFKNGEGTTLLGYLLTPTFTSGDWYSPFRADDEFPNLCVHHDAKGNKPAYDDCSKVKNVSHITYYGRSTPAGEDPPPTQVTEPGTLVLVVFGLASLAFARRRQTI